jgi:hypothetical protein
MDRTFLEKAERELALALNNNDPKGIEQWCKRFYQEESNNNLLLKKNTSEFASKFSEINKRLSKNDSSDSLIDKLMELGRMVLETIQKRLAGITKPILPIVAATSFIASPLEQTIATETPSPQNSGPPIPELHFPTPIGDRENRQWADMLIYQYVEKQLDNIGFTDQEVREYWGLVGKNGIEDSNKMKEAFETIFKRKNDIAKSPEEELTNKLSEIKRETNQNIENLNTDYHKVKDKEDKKSVGLIAVNHFKMDIVEGDLQKFKDAGIKTIAAELPENLQAELVEYLNGPRDQEAMLKFGQSWVDSAPNPDLEQTKNAIEMATGEKVNIEELKQGQHIPTPNPMDGNTTLKYLVNTLAKAHDMGFKVVAIDASLKASQEAEAGLEAFSWIAENSAMEARNRTMAKNLTSLTKDSRTVAIVGGAHTDHSKWTTTIQSLLKTEGVSPIVLSYESGSPDNPKEQLQNLFKREQTKRKMVQAHEMEM